MAGDCHCGCCGVNHQKSARTAVFLNRRGRPEPQGRSSNCGGSSNPNRRCAVTAGHGASPSTTSEYVSDVSPAGYPTRAGAHGHCFECRRVAGRCLHVRRAGLRVGLDRGARHAVGIGGARLQRPLATRRRPRHGGTGQRRARGAEELHGQRVLGVAVGDHLLGFAAQQLRARRTEGGGFRRSGGCLPTRISSLRGMTVTRIPHFIVLICSRASSRCALLMRSLVLAIAVARSASSARISALRIGRKSAVPTGAAPALRHHFAASTDFVQEAAVALKELVPAKALFATVQHLSSSSPTIRLPAMRTDRYSWPGGTCQ